MHPFLGAFGTSYGPVSRSNTTLANTGTVTSSATAYNNVTPVQMIASTAADASYLFIRSGTSFSVSTARNDAVVEVMAGSAGNEYTIIGPLTWGGKVAASGFGLPIFIPAGTRLSVRLRTTRTSQAHTFTLELGYGPNRDSAGLPQKWVAYGLVDDATSRATGTLVTAGSTNAWGSWTALTTSTTYAHDLWLPMIDKGTASTTTAMSYRSQWSIDTTANAATEVTNGTVREGPIWATTTSEVINEAYNSTGLSWVLGGVPPSNGIIYAPRAAGAAVSVRVMCNTTPDANAVGCSILAAL